MAKGRHAELDRLLFQDNAGSALVDHFTERIGDVEEFVDALAAPVSGVVAIVATLSVVEVLVANLVRAETELTEHRLGRFVSSAAVAADLADETLTQHAFERS